MGNDVVQSGNAQLSARQESIVEFESCKSYFYQKLDTYGKYYAAVTESEELAYKADKKFLLIAGIVWCGIWAFVGLTTGDGGVLQIIPLELTLGLPGIAVIVVWVLRHNSLMKKWGEATDKKDQLAAEIHQHYMNYPGLCPIGEEYAVPAVLEILEGYLRNGRADTIKEALNILVDDLHKQTVERNTAAAASAASAAADSASLSAAASVAGLLFRR